MADQATEIATSSSEPAAAQAPKISPLPDHLKMRQLEEGDREKGKLCRRRLVALRGFACVACAVLPRVPGARLQLVT